MRRWVELDADGRPVRGCDAEGVEVPPPPLTRALAAVFRPSAVELLSRMVDVDALGRLEPGGFVLVERRRDGSWRFTADVEGDTAAVAFADRVEEEPGARDLPPLVEMTVTLDGDPLGKWKGAT